MNIVGLIGDITIQYDGECYILSQGGSVVIIPADAMLALLRFWQRRQ